MRLTTVGVKHSPSTWHDPGRPCLVVCWRSRTCCNRMPQHQSTMPEHTLTRKKRASTHIRIATAGRVCVQMGSNCKITVCTDSTCYSSPLDRRSSTRPLCTMEKEKRTWAPIHNPDTRLCHTPRLRRERKRSERPPYIMHALLGQKGRSRTSNNGLHAPSHARL